MSGFLTRNRHNLLGLVNPMDRLENILPIDAEHIFVHGSGSGAVGQCMA